MDLSRGRRYQCLSSHGASKQNDLVWIGNWGDEERTQELMEFLVEPAIDLIASRRRVLVHGVRYPEEARNTLQRSGIEYSGYLPNLSAPEVYARSRLALHVPRRQYANGLSGVPTIRVFEVLACGIPLVCAPWADTEQLFRAGQDYVLARNGAEMSACLARTAGERSYSPANCIEWTGNHSAASYLQASSRAVDGDLRRNHAMRMFVFGSSITSSYWNGAATYYRGIYKSSGGVGS